MMWLPRSQEVMNPVGTMQCPSLRLRTVLSSFLLALQKAERVLYPMPAATRGQTCASRKALCDHRRDGRMCLQAAVIRRKEIELQLPVLFPMCCNVL